MSIGEEEDVFGLEFSAAYPEVQGLLSLERSLRWSKEGLPKLTLHDKVLFENSWIGNGLGSGDAASNGAGEAKQGTELTERFITLLEPQLEGGGRVTLTAKHRLTIDYDDAQWTPVINARNDMDHFGKERHWYTLDFLRLQQPAYSDTIEATFSFQFNEG